MNDRIMNQPKPARTMIRTRAIAQKTKWLCKVEICFQGEIAKRLLIQLKKQKKQANAFN